jgi:phage terminase large subunit
MAGPNKNLVALLENNQAAEKASIVCLEGSTRSGKTWSWIEYCFNLCAQYPELIVSAFRHDASTHERGAIRDFKRLAVDRRYKPIWDKGRWNNQLKTFYFDNGSVLEFVGTNDPGKLHGPERDIAVLNEVMEINYEAYRQILSRTRLLTILDWNPSLNHHWVFDKVLTRDDVLYVHSTYKDNPHLTAKQVDEIERTNPAILDNVRQGTADKWYWEVYGLGKRGRKEGCIFEMWDVVDNWPERHLCQRWGFGLDYGFSQDPTALVECALFRDELYLREHLYETQLVAQSNPLDPSIDSIEGRLRAVGIPEDTRIHDDNARPEITQALRMAGFKIVSTQKGPGSVIAGIDRLRSLPIKVHRSSQNLQMEMESYSWAQNSRKEWLDIPEDRNNHLIDAARYWAMAELKPLRKPRHTRPRRSRNKTSLQKWR